MKKQVKILITVAFAVLLAQGQPSYAQQDTNTTRWFSVITSTNSESDDVSAVFREMATNNTGRTIVIQLLQGERPDIDGDLAYPRKEWTHLLAFETIKDTFNASNDFNTLDLVVRSSNAVERIQERVAEFLAAQYALYPTNTFLILTWILQNGRPRVIEGALSGIEQYNLVCLQSNVTALVSATEHQVDALGTLVSLAKGMTNQQDRTTIETFIRSDLTTTNAYKRADTFKLLWDSGLMTTTDVANALTDNSDFVSDVAVAYLADQRPADLPMALLNLMSNNVMTVQMAQSIGTTYMPGMEQLLQLVRMHEQQTSEHRIRYHLRRFLLSADTTGLPLGPPPAMVSVDVTTNQVGLRVRWTCADNIEGFIVVCGATVTSCWTTATNSFTKVDGTTVQWIELRPSDGHCGLWFARSNEVTFASFPSSNVVSVAPVVRRKDSYVIATNVLSRLVAGGVQTETTNSAFKVAGQEVTSLLNLVQQPRQYTNRLVGITGHVLQHGGEAVHVVQTMNHPFYSAFEISRMTKEFTDGTETIRMDFGQLSGTGGESSLLIGVVHESCITNQFVFQPLWEVLK